MSDKTKKKKNVKFLDRFSAKSKHTALRMLVSILIGLALAIVLIFIASDRPLTSIQYLFTAPLTSWPYFSMWMQNTLPLIFTGVAVCIMFSANQFNLGLEGSFLFGGFVGGALANIYLFKGTPVLGIIGGCIIGGIVGAIITLIPAILEKLVGASIMVTSLMMNYICLWVSQWLLFSYFKDPKTSAGSYYWTDGRNPIFVSTFGKGNSKLTVYWAFLLAILVVFVCWVLLFRTKLGFRIRMVGHNKDFAKYIGVSVPFIAIISQVIGGFIGGVGGAAEVLSIFTSYSWQDLTGFGWDGVTMAIFAGNNPKNVPIAALFIGYLRTGAYIMSLKTGVQNDLTSVVEGVIILFLLAERFLQGTYRKMIIKEAERERDALLLEKEGE